jgi:ParB/RepB/Spo0J family partition protein
MARKTNKVGSPELSSFSLPVTTHPLELAQHLDRDQEHEIKYIALDDIFPSPSNPRRHIDSGMIKELADSISKFGVIQPVTLRGKRGMAGKFELVCGERRWEASKLASRQTIPAIVRDLSDDEVLDLQFTENLQRQDVHPMDEAVTFKAMIATNRYTIADIAAKVLKSDAFVAQRLSLNNLIQEFQEDFWADKFLIGHAILFSRLPVADQKEIYMHHRCDRHYESLRETKDYIDRNIIRKLSSAPFKRDDATLVPAAGPCITCPKRSGCNTSLFSDYSDDDRCFDQACFQQKLDAFVIAKVKSTIETKPEILLVETDSYGEKVPPAVKKITSDMKVDIIKAGYGTISGHQMSGSVAVKVLMVSGSDAGKIKTMYAQSKKAKAAAGAADGKPAKRTAEHVQDDIDALKTRQERALELDSEKVWKEVKDLLKDPAELTKVPFPSATFTQEERNAIAIALLGQMDSKYSEYEEAALAAIGLKDNTNLWELDREDYEKLKVKDSQLFHLLRLFMLSCLMDGLSHLSDDKPFMLMKVLRSPLYAKGHIEVIEAAQNAESAKRIANSSKRMEALKAEKKSLGGKLPKTPAKKAGKGKAKLIIDDDDEIGSGYDSLEEITGMEDGVVDDD